MERSNAAAVVVVGLVAPDPWLHTLMSLLLQLSPSPRIRVFLFGALVPEVVLPAAHEQPKRLIKARSTPPTEVVTLLLQAIAVAVEATQVRVEEAPLVAAKRPTHQ